MDIGKISAINYRLDVVHPANESLKIGLTIELRNTDDETVKSEQRRIIDKINHKRIRGKVPKTEETEGDRLEYLISAIVGWDWSPDGSLNGEKPTFSAANARKLYAAAPWIFDQIDEALAERANFFRN